MVTIRKLERKTPYTESERRRLMIEIRNRQGDSSFPINPDDLATLFSLYDIDGSGALSLEEFVDVVNDIRQGRAKVGHKFTKAQIRRFMNWMDKNESAEIDEKEFSDFFNCVKKMEEFQNNMDREAQKASSQRLTLTLYFFTVVMVFGYFFMTYLQESSETTEASSEGNSNEDAPKGVQKTTTTGLILSSIGLVFGIFWMLILPILDIYYEEARDNGKIDALYDKVAGKWGAMQREKKYAAKIDPEKTRRTLEAWEKEEIAMKEKQLHAESKFKFTFRPSQLTDDQFDENPQDLRKKDIEDYWEVVRQQGRHINPDSEEFDDGRGGAKEMWQAQDGNHNTVFGQRDYTIGSRASEKNAGQGRGLLSTAGSGKSRRPSFDEAFDRMNATGSRRPGGRQSAAVSRIDAKRRESASRPNTTPGGGVGLEDTLGSGKPRPIHSRGGMRGGVRSGHATPTTYDAYGNAGSRQGSNQQLGFAGGREDPTRFDGSIEPRMDSSANGSVAYPGSPAGSPFGGRGYPGSQFFPGQPTQAGRQIDKRMVPKRDIYTPDLYTEAKRAQVETAAGDYFQSLHVAKTWRNEWLSVERAKAGIEGEPDGTMAPQYELEESSDEDENPMVAKSKLFKSRHYG